MVLGACEGGINCVGLTQNWAQIYFFGSYFSLLLLLAIFFIFWKTPALEYVIAIITGKSLVLITNRSNQGRIRTAKPTAEGILEIRKVGPALITENSHIVDNLCGRPMYIVHGEFASTIPLWWVSVLNTLKRKFSKGAKPMLNSSDYAAEIGLEFNEKTGGYQKDDKNKDTEIDDIPIKPWITLKLLDLPNMFPYNITPALMESKMEYALARQMKFWKTDTGKLMVYAMVLIIVVIAGYLALKLYPGLTSGGEMKITIDQVGNIIGKNVSMSG